MNDQRGYFGLTDPDWYDFLSGCPRVDEVNFWQPHGNQAFRAVSPGEPFFFKLRAPAKAIAGFGFFQRFESLPAWLAWECFREMNGASDFRSMCEQLARLRKEETPLSGDFRIGCIMISAPVFFRREEWIEPPNDWPRTGIQRGKTYHSLETGEGARIYRQCLERAKTGTHYWNVERSPQAPVAEGDRFGSPLLVRPRLGQGIFSVLVRQAYGGACAVTHEHSTPVLEAAHIVPYAQGGEHQVTNGLLLRSDLHRLYDRGYVTVTPDYVFKVGDRLRDEYKNGRIYYDLQDSRIMLPQDSHLRPERELLEWHQSTVFMG